MILWKLANMYCTKGIIRFWSIVPFLCWLAVDQLSKVKNDLEAALKDVLQAVRINQEAAAPDAAFNIYSVEQLANVSSLLSLNLFSLDTTTTPLPQSGLSTGAAGIKVFAPPWGDKGGSMMAFESQASLGVAGMTDCTSRSSSIDHQRLFLSFGQSELFLAFCLCLFCVIFYGSNPVQPSSWHFLGYRLKAVWAVVTSWGISLHSYQKQWTDAPPRYFSFFG